MSSRRAQGPSVAKAKGRFDLVVIGSGPAGEGAAMMAAKNGKSVVVVEEFTDVGGGCTHWGTIPSKALRLVRASASAATTCTSATSRARR